MIYNIAWTDTEDVAAAEEILQDVFMLVWKHCVKLPEVKDFPAWGYTK